MFLYLEIVLFILSILPLLLLTFILLGLKLLCDCLLLLFLLSSNLTHHLVHNGRDLAFAPGQCLLVYLINCLVLYTDTLVVEATHATQSLNSSSLVYKGTSNHHGDTILRFWRTHIQPASSVLLIDDIYWITVALLSVHFSQIFIWSILCDCFDALKGSKCGV